MIDARQVRIGNYLKPYHGDYVVVTAIQGDGRIIHTPNSIGAVNDIMVEGIPLTKELLTDWLGFKPYPMPFGLEGWKYNANGNDLFFSSDVEFYCEDDMGIVFQSSPNKYLHQLQNLYFALTGVELEIKIPVKA